MERGEKTGNNSLGISGSTFMARTGAQEKQPMVSDHLTTHREKKTLLCVPV